MTLTVKTILITAAISTTCGALGGIAAFRYQQIAQEKTAQTHTFKSIRAEETEIGKGAPNAIRLYIDEKEDNPKIELKSKNGSLAQLQPNLVSISSAHKDGAKKEDAEDSNEIKLFIGEKSDEKPRIEVNSEEGDFARLAPNSFVMTDGAVKNQVAISADKQGTRLLLFRNQARAVSVSSDIDGNRVSIFDDTGDSRANLGATSLVNKTSGTVTKKSEASIVLFNKKGDVIFELPRE